MRVVTSPVSPLAFETMFPGKDARDCERDTNDDQQMRLGCTGRADRFGHFREPEIVSSKLHWVWMWNWIFSVFLPPSFAGNVLAVSDDCLIRSSAFYSNVKMLWKLQPKLCPDCRGISVLNPVRAEEGNKRLIVAESGNKA